MPYNCGRGSPIPKGFTNLTCSDSRAVRATPRGVLTELGVLLAQPVESGRPQRARFSLPRIHRPSSTILPRPQPLTCHRSPVPQPPGPQCSVLLGHSTILCAHLPKEVPASTRCSGGPDPEAAEDTDMVAPLVHDAHLPPALEGLLHSHHTHDLGPSPRRLCSLPFLLACPPPHILPWNPLSSPPHVSRPLLGQGSGARPSWGTQPTADHPLPCLFTVLPHGNKTLTAHADPAQATWSATPTPALRTSTVGHMSP